MLNDGEQQLGLQTVEQLISILHNGTLEQIEKAHAALLKFGEEALTPLIKDLSNDNNTRLNVVSVIGSFCDAKEVMKPDLNILRSALIPLLNILSAEENNSTKQNIVLTLGGIPDKRVVEPLLNHLRDKDGEVFLPTIYALGKTKDERGIVALIKLLAEEGNYVRFDVLESLRAVEADQLITIFQHPLVIENLTLRQTTIDIMGEIGNVQTLSLLESQIINVTAESEKLAIFEAIKKIKQRLPLTNF